MQINAIMVSALYGLLILIVGYLVFVSNPQGGRWTLLAFGAAGNLMLLWAILMRKGWRHAPLGSLLTLLLIAGALSWFAFRSWKGALTEGEGTAAAVISTGLLAATVAAMPYIIRHWREGREEPSRLGM
ncbi:MAG: hypothetical protein IH874_00425 [Candidatus Dadabacteria bacterium]|nr:hypothetical protein [Candidatus Dadabacteria bacterium]